MGARILLVDDESSILSVLKALLSAEGHDVVAIQNGNQAVTAIQNEKFDLMVSDIRMTPINGMELLALARQAQPSMAVIMITAYASVETAVEAVKMGAYDYVTKPFKINELLSALHSALKYSRTLSENVDLHAQAASALVMGEIVAESVAMRNVCELIRHVAPTSATVFLSGEKGTGKTLVAHTLHLNSDRKDKPFTTLDCATVAQPELDQNLFGFVPSGVPRVAHRPGLFENTGGGTVYLSNIDALPLDTQDRLLNMLQDKKICPIGSTSELPMDARLLAASFANLQQAMREGSFREDLYQRISVIPIRIKPLRERREDILPIVAHTIKRLLPDATGFPTLAPSARDALMRHHWPGNVSQLIDTVSHALSASHGEAITQESLPEDLVVPSPAQASGSGPQTGDNNKGRSLRAYLRNKEKEYLDQVLKYAGGDKTKAAKALRISLATLYRKLPNHDGASPPDNSQP